MSKGTKYVFSWIVVFLALSWLYERILYDFSEFKWFYATIYPSEYFAKDVLIYESKTNGPQRTGRYSYNFYGTLKKFKKKRKVYFTQKGMNKIWTTDGAPKDKLKIPVWYNTMDGAISIRTSENFPRPYSRKIIEVYLNIITWLLFLPSIVYIVSYHIKKRKNKILEN
ncbi:hypothetical protein [Maribacter polysaccharolyticus]|uniref:hypothetical protein n=1 Tax=Maribacter polysaccharolyticus TaxID=3020831 RepID=UPI00237EFC0B|nr:hypothetical protein [Maribacter polysaccharolyticus]MDE3744148.1 hypothetical protein [Maribacter polysaccharolyticus]